MCWGKEFQILIADGLWEEEVLAAIQLCCWYHGLSELGDSQIVSIYINLDSQS